MRSIVPRDFNLSCKSPMRSAKSKGISHLSRSFHAPLLSDGQNMVVCQKFELTAAEFVLSGEILDEGLPE